MKKRRVHGMITDKFYIKHNPTGNILYESMIETVGDKEKTIYEPAIFNSREDAEKYLQYM